jgi:peptidoglycan L-alanyl-D-glutamate endopeptidase CwlK
MIEEQWLFLQDVSLLIQTAKELGVVLTAGEMYRTSAQQQYYFDNGLSKTMNSNHMRRLAVDFNFFINGKQTYEHDIITALGVFWEGLNKKNKWGGNFKTFKDTLHFERSLV